MDNWKNKYNVRLFLNVLDIKKAARGLFVGALFFLFFNIIAFEESGELGRKLLPPRFC